MRRVIRTGSMGQWLSSIILSMWKHPRNRLKSASCTHTNIKKINIYFFTSINFNIYKFFIAINVSLSLFSNFYLWRIIFSLLFLSNKFFKYMFSFNIFACIYAIIIIFLQIKILLFTQETREKEKCLCEDPKNLEARDRGLSDYYSESSILESSARRWVSDPPDADDPRSTSEMATTDSIQPIDGGHLWWSEIPYTPNYFHS